MNPLFFMNPGSFLGTRALLLIQGTVIHFNLHMMKLRCDEWIYRMKVSHASLDMSTKISNPQPVFPQCFDFTVGLFVTECQMYICTTVFTTMKKKRLLFTRCIVLNLL